LLWNRGFYYSLLEQFIIRSSFKPQKHPILKAFLIKILTLLICLSILAGCSSLMKSATSGLASNLSMAILNQNDPETVRDGAPAFLIMLDSFVESSPNDAAMLSAAGELYAAYGVVFVKDAERAERLTSRARSYGQRALCVSNQKACGIDDMPFKEFESVLSHLGKKDTASLYTYGLTGLAYIKTHSSEWGAMANLPRVEAALNRVHQLDNQYQAVQVERYLAVLNTIRPPALGGKFDQGKAHYEKAL
jgi:uncharacterized protein YceK